MGFLGYFLKERHLKDILAKKKALWGNLSQRY